jgi:dipeptide/tripeptide permease
MQINFSTNDWDFIMQLLPFIIPLALIQIGLGIFVIIDLVKKQQTKTLSPVAWLIIGLCLNTVGPILYIIFGRSESAKSDDNDDI